MTGGRVKAVCGAAFSLALMFTNVAEARPVTVKPGAEVGLLNVALFRHYDCKPIKVVIKVVQAPKHGTLRQVRATLNPADAKSGDDFFGRCNGKKLQSLAYMYRANSGYKGKDRVVLRVMASTDGSGNYGFEIVVE
ncbi:hypothetical protein [Aquibium oceanicum]|uniref:Uncharacterized protein n=1 Tax=Aquibium oceanicum TaxID=1670800 RepID=A0A1L3SKQ9_9HYPH|nr:hypothetical protein [Aquibium oceanicum]APH69968.1 hypothetical protein BSQ44_00180 [Aquibium oceanicum]